MMYQIKANDTVIYDTRYIDDYPILTPELDLGLNQAGTLGFTVLPNHPYYSHLHQMKTFITVFHDEEELFRGRILNIEKDVYGQMAVNCEGAFTFFLDSEIEAGEVTETIAEFIQRCIGYHNDQVEEAKRFTLGQITADKAVEIDPRTGETIKIVFKNQDYSQTKNVLESLITSKYGGFFRIRPNPNGYPFLDYIQSYGRTNTQPIKIAENISEKSDNISGQNIFTILRPLGKDNLTIDTLAQSDVTLPNVVKDGKLLRLTDKIALYGNIIRTERFSDLDEPHYLLKAAEDFISRYGSQLPATSNITYVDFHRFNPEVMGVKLGDTFTNIEGYPDQVLTVSEVHIVLDNSEADEMTLQNQEQLNANDPASTSGSLSSHYASQCTHTDYIYKYIHEGDNRLLLATERIEIQADRLIELADNVQLISGELNAISEDLDEIEGSALWLTRNNITAVTGNMHMDQQGNIVVNSGVGLKIERNEGGQVSSFGVYDTGNLTGGILVQQINSSDTLVQILASKIDLSGYVTANQLSTEFANLETAYANSLTTHTLTADVLNAASVWFNGDECRFIRKTVVTDIVNGSPVTDVCIYVGLA